MRGWAGSLSVLIIEQGINGSVNGTKWWNRSADCRCYLLSLKAASLLFCCLFSIYKSTLWSAVVSWSLCYHSNLFDWLFFFFFFSFLSITAKWTSMLSAFGLFIFRSQDKNMNDSVTTMTTRTNDDSQLKPCCMKRNRLTGNWFDGYRGKKPGYIWLKQQGVT